MEGGRGEGRRREKEAKRMSEDLQKEYCKRGTIESPILPREHILIHSNGVHLSSMG